MSENAGLAIEGFEALREEVAKLRSGVERIYKRGKEIKTAATPKNYGLPLGSVENTEIYNDISWAS